MKLSLNTEILDKSLSLVDILLSVTLDRMFMMVSLPLSQKRRNFMLHIIASFVIGIGLSVPQFFAFTTGEVNSSLPHSYNLILSSG